MAWDVKRSLDRIRNKCRSKRWITGDAAESFTEYMDALKIYAIAGMITEDEYIARKRAWIYEYEQEGYEIVRR